MKIEPSVKYSHTILSQVIKPGDNVIDATVGKGNDTEFMANLVGNHGHVYGFDLQGEAIKYTKKRLTDKSLINNVDLFNTGHENIHSYVDKPISAAIFNLGYLPGSDKNIITKPETTLSALQDCLNLLLVNGIVIAVIYYGHNGGKEEKNAVLDWANKLDQKKYTSLQYQFINQIHCPPILLAIQKKSN